jgi:outer membrane immunogenic protein
MMRTLFTSIAILGMSGLGMAGAALAADLPSRNFAPAPMSSFAAPSFTWTGIYGGVNAGYAWAGERGNSFSIPAGTFSTDPTVSGTVTYDSRSNRGGFTGGGQLGYNHQIDQFVVGVEMDIQHVGLRRSNASPLVSPGFPASYTPPPISGGVDWYGTLRGRAGYAFDRTLVYGTGGLAYGNANDNRVFPFSKRNDTRIGWAAGAGVDHAIADNVILGLEGMYVDLQRSGRTGNGGSYVAGGTTVPVTVNRKDNSNQFGVLRARMNYKF